jgi:predicted nucleic acid-binding protein
LTTLLLDASVLLAAFDQKTTTTSQHEPCLKDGKATLATLDLARYKVANVAVRAWLAPESVAPLLAAIERLADDGGVLASTGALLARAAEIAERHTISVTPQPMQPLPAMPAITSSAATSAIYSRSYLRTFAPRKGGTISDGSDSWQHCQHATRK